MVGRNEGAVATIKPSKGLDMVVTGLAPVEHTDDWVKMIFHRSDGRDVRIWLPREAFRGCILTMLRAPSLVLQ